MLLRKPRERIRAAAKENGGWSASVSSVTYSQNGMSLNPSFSMGYSGSNFMKTGPFLASADDSPRGYMLWPPIIVRAPYRLQSSAYSWMANSRAGLASSQGGGYTIDMQRIAESPNATVSEFTAYGPAPLRPVTGYILEPGGPSTTTANQDKRIPAGTYSIDPYSSTKYSNHYIVSNSYVSQDRRILIHSGNYHSNTLGCLLPGRSYSMVGGNYAVWNSGATLNSLRSLIGRNSATLNIYDINTTPTLNFSNW